MDFTPDESTADLTTLTADIASTISTPERVAELESAAAPLDTELWTELAKAGLLGLEQSGDGLTVADNVAVATELGRQLARVPFGPHAVVAGPVIAGFGPEPLGGEVLPGIADGSTIVTVAAEEDLRTQPLTATTTSEGLTLSGVKVNVPFAAAATLLLATATGPDGPLAALVDAGAAGVTITATPVTGLSPAAQVTFDAVPVDPSRILATGAVDAIAARSRLAVAADQTGVVAQALSLTAEYAREREQFDRPIGSFQAVSQRLADGYINAQALGVTTQQAAWLLAQNDPSAPTAIATAKFWAAEAGHHVAHATVHIHGGIGLDTSHPVHRYFLRAKQNEFTAGSASATLLDIGEYLAAAPA
ncbi:acyl-CoA dehydrogenase [Gordonia amarae]|uniref:Acyl-CoA dehydrogenase n=2 Tax=Gordonia amarae TaxID=36821 RepID=A0A857LRS9_9ACTN|nr:acyl-CoA dehydrogenase family protein [Gordonia amarae]MCS3880659.1 alkylation response protein AidB-like acyl-CoA dehydrogenase [Gordonia amarae]QHN18958.1 acyl-CoA dehydrogenase [Gordonia amarae]QHN23433.1 acyl-CoA dehydrogenase [Gordonia amarae]QHN32334.1 acyl-CoA dehydrogenase [Gordonia amarae]QHN41082.1 acyl-CoA dehydrogenase [Gordonia amarae]